MVKVASERVSSGFALAEVIVTLTNALLAAVVAAGQLVDTIAPRLPKLQKPKSDVGVVGRRTAG